MSDWFRRLFLYVPRRHRWCACGDSRATGIHSAAECGPLPWGF